MSKAKDAPSSAKTNAPAAGRSRLGRGLSSLMQVNGSDEGGNVPHGTSGDAGQFVEGPLREVSPDTIKPNPHQPRREMDPATLSELAASIKTNGVIQPLVVIERGKDHYELIAGERRLRASKMAGVESVPVVVRTAEAHEQAQMALVENIQREDLNPIDRAEAYRTLQKQLGLTQAELAERTGEDRSTVANHLRLLDLADSVRDLVRNGDLPLGHAKVLAGVADEEDQVSLARLCVKQGLSVRNLERLTKDGEDRPRSPSDGASKDGAAVHFKSLGDNVSRSLGMKANVAPAGRKGGGTLTVHFTNSDQFDRLMERLGVELD